MEACQIGMFPKKGSRERCQFGPALIVHKRLILMSMGYQ